MVDFTLYNVMLDRLLLVRCWAEITKAGGVMTSYDATVVSPHALPINKNASVLKQASVIIVSVFYLYYFVEEFHKIKRQGLKYFTMPDNIAHDLNLIVYLLVWLFRYLAYSYSPEQLYGTVEVDSDNFYYFYSCCNNYNNH